MLALVIAVICELPVPPLGVLTEASAGRAFRQGVREGIPFAAAGFLLAVSFGVVAQDAGLSAVEAIAMSLIVFAGSAQFAAIAIIGGGGTVGAAIGAAALMNSRFLPMGAALGPSLPGGPLNAGGAGPSRPRRPVGALRPRRRELRSLAPVRRVRRSVRGLAGRHDRGGARR